MFHAKKGRYCCAQRPICTTIRYRFLKHMARLTPTRALVRKYAQQIHEQGGTPTLAMLKRMLGNKGSPNTVLDELRRWQEDLGARPAAAPAHAGQPRTAPATSDEEAASASAEVASVAKQLQDAAASLRTAEALPALVQALTTQFNALGERLAADRQWMQKELELMNARFEAVQRRALLQIDEARGEATKWREKHLQVQAEFATWKDANRQRSQKLMDENAWLRGKLGMPVGGPPTNDESASAALSPSLPQSHAGARPSGYPGHPRAVGGGLE